MTGIAARANEDRPMLGIALMLVAYLVFSCIDTSVKWLAIAGLSALQLSFMRYVGAFLISLFMIARGGIHPSRFASRHLLLVIVRGALLMGSTVFNFIAVRYLPLTLTATILFSAPIIICALSWPLLGERVGVWRWSAIMVGFFGILIAIRPFNESFHWAVFLSLGAASCFAMYTIITRKLSGIVATDTMQFYAGLVGTLALAPFAFMEWQNPVGGLDWFLLVMLGVFGWLGHQLMTGALGYAPPSTVTPLSYSFIIYLTVWSFFLFDHLPDRWTVSGALIIVVAGLIIWYREHKLSMQRQTLEPGDVPAAPPPGAGPPN
ncbi:MAG: DMT family transporter [Alphaproteobacteria bacterium]|nr:DMT family transporter [Alphaproteobacteria bacterium]